MVVRSQTASGQSDNGPLSGFQMLNICQDGLIMAVVARVSAILEHLKSVTLHTRRSLSTYHVNQIAAFLECIICQSQTMDSPATL